MLREARSDRAARKLPFYVAIRVEYLSLSREITLCNIIYLVGWEILTQYITVDLVSFQT